MKLFKRLFKIALAFVVIVCFMVLILFGLDLMRTAYLKPEKESPDALLITNAHVIPMNQDTVLMNKTVYVKNGFIQAIEDHMEIQDVEILNANGQYLVPGLADMHVHLWDKYELGLYLSHGVTSIRNVWGQPMHLRLKKEIDKEAIYSPLFYTTGPKLTGPEFIGDDNLQLGSPEEARDKVVSYKARGFDFIKTYYGLTEEIFDAVIDQARRSGMDIVAHPSQKVPYTYHFNPQIASVEHVEDIVQQPLGYELDTIRLKEIVEAFSSAPATSFCPTLMAFYNIYNMLQNEDILSSEPVRLINPAIQKVDSKGQFERWQAAKSEDAAIAERIKAQHDFHLLILKKLHEAGVNIICGTDAGIGITVPGASIHQELAFYSEAGLSNYEVLKTATVNTSKVHKLMSQTGSIEVGKMANFLLLKTNPLTDLTALRQPGAVFIKGRMLGRNTLDTFVKKARGRKNLLVSVLRYVENLLVEN